MFFAKSTEQFGGLNLYGEDDIRAIARPLHHLEEFDLQVHADRQSQDVPVDHRPHAVPAADEPLAFEPGQGVPELRAADGHAFGQGLQPVPARRIPGGHPHEPQTTDRKSVV